MKLDFGSILVIACVLLFYLRLISLQWGKARRAQNRRLRQQQQAQKGKKVKAEPAPTYGVQVSNWWLIGGGIALIAAGTAINFYAPAGSWFQGLWWLPVCGGVGLFAFSFR